MQPCDWQEHDWQDRDKGNKFYVIDAYGRNPDGDVVRLRITGFKPYFYMDKIEGVSFVGVKTTEHQKHDIFAGFGRFQTKTVWKIECSSLASFRETIKLAKSNDARIYESNLPPLLRFFHERGIGPASPLAFQSNKVDPHAEQEAVKCDVCYIADYRDVQSDPSKTIPLKVAAYDIECYSASGNFPLASNPEDAVIQIGITYRWSDNFMKVVRRKILVVGTVPENPEYISCPSEADLLQEFANLLEEDNPDVVVGYNTFGFDDQYIVQRAQRYRLKLQFGRARVWMNPGKSYPDNILEHKKFELATGTYDVNYIRMPGRLAIDLLLNMRREQNLDSYKLDNVASTFLRDKVLRTETEGEITRVYTKSTRGLQTNNFVKFDIVGNTSDPYREGEKFVVMHVAAAYFEIRSTSLFEDLDAKTKKQLEWTFTKDDIHPQDIFRMHKGTAQDRATIAKYCLQDCDLLPTLMAKLDTLVNARGMADVCMVPLQYLFLRGQGIKIYSRVAYEAMLRNQIILTQEGGEAEGGSYEGAIVISPKIGMYLDQPIAVLDYNSLYPSAMIAENLSPDTFVCEKVYDRNGKLTNPSDVPTEKIAEWKAAGYIVREVRYDIKDGENVVGKSVCLFVEPRDDEPLSVGIIPQTLKILLAKRKEVRQKAEYKTVHTCGGMVVSGLIGEKDGMLIVKEGSNVTKIEKSQVISVEDTYDDAQKSVFNGLQLAYKVVANSVYGQMGSNVSPIRKKCVAACTTAAGRDRLLFAKEYVETHFGAEVVAGDTDSIFIKFQTKDLAESIQLGMKAAEQITAQCRKPFVIGYEKTLFPFILFCRKRYVGMLYEDDPNVKPKRKAMGIVLRRRDNAPIVKDVFGGALDILLERGTVQQAAAFVQDQLSKVIRNQLPMEKYVITKQLRDDYKDPAKIAHRVLADRMTERDPGNAPTVGDRMSFLYVQQENPTGKKVLQGDRIESLDYAKEKKLKPDTTFYITNQIQNPVAQLFALCIERLDGYMEPRPTYKQRYDAFLEELGDPEEATLKVLALKEKQLDSLMFLNSSAMKNLVRANTVGPLDRMFKRV